MTEITPEIRKKVLSEEYKKSKRCTEIFKGPFQQQLYTMLIDNGQLHIGDIKRIYKSKDDVEIFIKRCELYDIAKFSQTSQILKAKVPT